MALRAPLRYLLDTNILIHYARAGVLARYIKSRYSLRASSTSPLVSIVTVGEVRAFALRHNWGVAKQRELQGILDDCDIAPLNSMDIVEAYAELSIYTDSVGRTMGDNDLWIAATTNVTGARLLTTDRDFDHLHPAYVQRDWIDPSSKLPGTP